MFLAQFFSVAFLLSILLIPLHFIQIWYESKKKDISWDLTNGLRYLKTTINLGVISVLGLVISSFFTQ